MEIDPGPAAVSGAGAPGPGGGSAGGAPDDAREARAGGARHAARVLAIANQKGGVGKTTTAVNLAASLAACERSTLLVDMDPQGNASSAFDIRDPELHIYDALMGSCVTKDAVHATELPHLQVVPAGPDLVGAEIELVSSEHRERRLERALADVRGSYEFVILDCPPSLGLLTLNALTAANGVLIPLQCEYYALEGLARLTDTVGRVQEAFNPNLEIEGVVLTLLDRRNNLARQVEGEVRGHFGDAVYRTSIPRNVRLSEAPSHGKPVLLYDIRSTGAVAYLNLAKELLERSARRDDVGRSHDVHGEVSPHEGAPARDESAAPRGEES